MSYTWHLPIHILSKQVVQEKDTMKSYTKALELKQPEFLKKEQVV